jgi:hypothetical protein
VSLPPQRLEHLEVLAAALGHAVGKAGDAGLGEGHALHLDECLWPNLVVLREREIQTRPNGACVVAYAHLARDPGKAPQSPRPARLECRLGDGIGPPRVQPDPDPADPHHLEAVGELWRR